MKYILVYRQATSLYCQYILKTLSQTKITWNDFQKPLRNIFVIITKIILGIISTCIVSKYNSIFEIVCKDQYWLHKYSLVYVNVIAVSIFSRQVLSMSKIKSRCNISMHPSKKKKKHIFPLMLKANNLISPTFICIQIFSPYSVSFS